MNEWISVKDKLPTEDEPVLCIYQTYFGDNFAVASLVKGSWRDYQYEHIDRITHWMPLPAPPEIKNE